MLKRRASDAGPLVSNPDGCALLAFAFPAFLSFAGRPASSNVMPYPIGIPAQILLAPASYVLSSGITSTIGF